MKFSNITTLSLILSLSIFSLSCSTKSPESSSPNNGETDSHSVICLDLQTGKVMEGWCFIDGECVEIEQRSEEGGCGVCDPSDAKYAWTPVPDGTECTTEQGDDAGYCQSGHCVVATCECDEASLCCDGCHPINIGDPCGDGAECASHTCTESGECHFSILDGWCLEGTGTESDPYACFDTHTNPNNCGTCGHKCLEEQECVAGECVSLCAEDLTFCDVACVDLQSNEMHCGTCHHDCPADAICMSGQCIVLVTGVSVSPKTLILSPGGAGTLTATIAPPTAHNQNVTWESADASIATVNQSGQVQAHRVGETTITATTEEGVFSDTAIVKVHDTYGPCENEGDVVMQPHLCVGDTYRFLRCEKTLSGELALFYQEAPSVCVSDTVLITCDDGQMNIAPCAQCNNLDGESQCIVAVLDDECAPEDFFPVCHDDNTKLRCAEDGDSALGGKLVASACDGDTPDCIMGECVLRPVLGAPCGDDAPDYCSDNNRLLYCKDGKYVAKACGGKSCSMRNVQGHIHGDCTVGACDDIGERLPVESQGALPLHDGCAAGDGLFYSWNCARTQYGLGEWFLESGLLACMDSHVHRCEGTAPLTSESLCLGSDTMLSCDGAEWVEAACTQCVEVDKTRSVCIDEGAACDPADQRNICWDAHTAMRCLSDGQGGHAYAPFTCPRDANTCVWGGHCVDKEAPSGGKPCKQGQTFACGEDGALYYCDGGNYLWRMERDCSANNAACSEFVAQSGALQAQCSKGTCDTLGAVKYADVLCREHMGGGYDHTYLARCDLTLDGSLQWMDHFAPEGFCTDDGMHVECNIHGVPIVREVEKCTNIDEGDDIKPEIEEGPAEGDDCDPGSFVASVCAPDGRALVCEEDVVVAVGCAAENPVCKRGQCVVAEEGAECGNRFVEHCDQDKALYCEDRKVRALDCTGIQGTNCGVSVGGVADCYQGCSEVGEIVSACDIEWYQRPVSRQYTCQKLRNGEYGAVYTGTEACDHGCDSTSGQCSM